MELSFEQDVYTVSESEDSEVLVCMIADEVNRPFSVSLSSVSGTATG